MFFRTTLRPPVLSAMIFFTRRLFESSVLGMVDAGANFGGGSVFKTSGHFMILVHWFIKRNPCTDLLLFLSNWAV